MERFSDIPTQELFHQWLRALTVLTEPGDRPMQERLRLIREVNDVQTHKLTIGHPATLEEIHEVIAALEDINRLRSREYGAHAMVASLLMRWLTEATGQTSAEIITRLSVTVEEMLDRFPPPDQPAAQ